MSTAGKDILGQLSFLHIFSACLLLHLTYVVLSRLIFHPLRSLPGPRLAAVTNKYQAYYEIWKDGGFVEHLSKLHDIYGPVVRVRPNELHFRTPEAYFDIYPSFSKFSKEPTFYKCFQEDESSFGFIDKLDHKRRRQILEPLFSRRAIMKVERLVQEKVDLFIEKLTINYSKTKPANLRHGLHAITMDIITAYCFAHSFDGLEAQDFEHPILTSLASAMPVMTASKHFPLLLKMDNLPDWVVHMLSPNLTGVRALKKFLSQQINGIFTNPSVLAQMDHETVYHHLITPELHKSQQVPSHKSLREEALVFLFAGTDTTGNALSLAIFHILNDIEARKKLDAELTQAWPDKDESLSFAVLEKLPYLTAVIKEALRLSLGVTAPLPRVNDSPVIIDGVAVPPNTVVSCGVSFVLLDPIIFPEPEKFMPERWMHKEHNLDRYLVVFSKGPRRCVAQTLAWCELYLVLGHVFRKLDMELFETRPEDIAFRYHTVPVWRGRPIRATVQAKSA